MCTEPVFVDLLRSPRIDSQPVGPVRQPYLSYRPARLHGLAKSIPRNRFLVSINIYKYGLSTVYIYLTELLADVLVLDLCEDIHCVARLSLTSPAELELAAAGFRIGWPHRPCMEAEFLNF